MRIVAMRGGELLQTRSVGMNRENLEIARAVAPHESNAVATRRPERKIVPFCRELGDGMIRQTHDAQSLALGTFGSVNDALSVGGERREGVVVDARCQH